MEEQIKILKEMAEAMKASSQELVEKIKQIKEKK